MRKLLAGIAMLLLMSFSHTDFYDVEIENIQTEFCEGFYDGYKEGYCDGEYSCTAPIPPMCPMPQMNMNTYKHGYNTGFKRGLKDKN